MHHDQLHRIAAAVVVRLEPIGQSQARGGCLTHPAAELDGVESSPGLRPALLNFEFQRTVSRLLEMQSLEYLARTHHAA